jgi:catechol 2,3-dioxygenase-like lactoylglutathione lyase family enzyme
MRTNTQVLTVLGVSALLAAATAAAHAQAPAPATTRVGVTGLMHAIHSTNDVEKTLAFYQAVFGLGGQVRPFASEGPQVLTDSPGASLRVAMTQLKGAFNFELTQFGNLERQLNKKPDIADPGAPMMKLLVKDLDQVVANAKTANATIVTRGAAPVMVATGNAVGNAKAIVMTDPDGYFLEAVQAPPDAIAAAANAPQAAGRGRGQAAPDNSLIVGAILGETVRDIDETLKYWNGVLGNEFTADAKFSNDAAMLDLMGLPKGASYRRAGGVIYGSNARMEFIEIKGVPRKPYDLRVTDANASGMALRVGRIRELLAKIKANNGRVLSRGGELVEWSATVRNVFVKDPNGLNLELVGSADPNQ